MSRNVEIKARVRDREAIVKLAKELSGTDVSLLQQHDVFYNSPNGRLKLRIVVENGQRKNELIWYSRPDVSGPKLSEYNKTDMPDDVAENLKETLVTSMGVKGEVKKQRWLAIVGQTRVHIDAVEGLGDFMELEVCLRPEQEVEEGEEIAHDLRKKLGVAEEDLLTGAYMDMLNNH